MGPILKASRPTYAKDVGIGDAVFLVDGNGAAAGAVTAKYLVPAKGLYNPYTKVQVQCSFQFRSHYLSAILSSEVRGTRG